MKEQTELELVLLARSGDKDAFGCLIERHQGLAYGLARRMVANHEIARELVQEALLQAYLSLKHLQDDSRFKSWFCGIVLNVCRSYLRDQKMPLFSLESLSGGLDFEALPFSATVPDPHEIAEEQELHRTVLNAVKLLSTQNRAVTLLFYYQQLSLQEIAAILGISVVAVKGRLYKARNQLKQQLLAEYLELEQPVTEVKKLSKGSKKRKRTMVKVTIADVVKKEVDGKPMYAVLLHDEVGQRAMPIWIGQFEGEFIAIGLRKLPLPRPLTFSFMAQLLEATGATLEEVQISALKNDTYYATVRLRNGETVSEIDARPSDALALAIQTGSPVYVTEEILEQAGINLPAEISGAASGKGLVNITKEIEARLQSRASFKKDSLELEKSQQELISYVFSNENV